MAKTKEKINTLKIEDKTLNNDIVELTDDEMGQVSGGSELHPREVEVD